MFQVPIPVLVASVSWRMKTRGWKQGHRELATTPSQSHQSLSSQPADTNHQQQQQQQPRAANEYGAVTPSHNGQSIFTFLHPETGLQALYGRCSCSCCSFSSWCC